MTDLDKIQANTDESSRVVRELEPNLLIFGLLCLMQLIGVVSVFLTLPLMLALLLLLVANIGAFIGLLIAGKSRLAFWAFITAALMFTSLLFTDWGFSMPDPEVTISWPNLVLACLAQLT